MGLVKTSEGVGSFWQNVPPPEMVAVGVGLTLMMNVTGVPVHPPNLGVMVMVAEPTIPGVKDGISVTPVWSASPMAEPPVRSKTTFPGVPVSATGSDRTSTQRATCPGEVAVGNGVTVTST